MATLIKGNFRAGVPIGMNKNIQVGTVLTEDILQQVNAEHQARVKLNISDPSGVRPFIDQPIVDGMFPDDIKERQNVLSKLVHEYRSANPNVIHAAGILAPDFVNSEDVSYLTNMYYQCQNAFNTMFAQLHENKILPETPKLESLIWENIAFPRMANNLHILRAAIIYFEQDKDALIIHILFVYAYGQASVFSSRFEI